MGERTAPPVGSRRKPRAHRAPLVTAVLVTILGAAVVVMNWPSSGPTPISEFTAPNAAPAGPSSTESMSPEDMDPSTVFIPSLEVYAPLQAMSTSGGSLQIPSKPERVGWDEASAPLDSVEGSTFLAGHVKASGRDGALVDLASIGPGARIYTKDAAGVVHEWVTRTLHVSKDKVMDASYFQVGGDRQLVVVTCTGPVVTNDDGRRSFRDSAIVTAVPAPSPAVAAVDEPDPKADRS